MSSSRAKQLIYTDDLYLDTSAANIALMFYSADKNYS